MHEPWQKIDFLHYQDHDIANVEGILRMWTALVKCKICTPTNIRLPNGKCSTFDDNIVIFHVQRAINGKSNTTGMPESCSRGTRNKHRTDIRMFGENMKRIKLIGMKLLPETSDRRIIKEVKTNNLFLTKWSAGLPFVQCGSNTTYYNEVIKMTPYQADFVFSSQICSRFTSC